MEPRMWNHLLQLDSQLCSDYNKWVLEVNYLRWGSEVAEPIWRIHHFLIDCIVIYVQRASTTLVIRKILGLHGLFPFTSEREFVQILHEGHPVVVAFSIKCPFTRHFEKVLEDAAAEFHPHIKFMRVECPKYPGFCITRQRKDYPFVEIFHSPEQAANQGKIADSKITKYAVKVLSFDYDCSTYGFREFFKRHGIHSSYSN